MPAKDDFHLADYSFKKDKLIMVASYVAHHDTNVWNQGTVEDPHPLNKFWAERFLIKTGSPHSGPLSPSFSGRRMDASATTRPAPPIRVDSMMQNLPRKPGVKFSLDGLTGSWLPYGGGQSLCPGRHFAKQEMLMSLAIMSTCFDIEILEERGEANLPDLRYFGLGVQPPKHKTRFRIRRRNFDDDSTFG
jgi:cytochrome P450